MKFDLNGRVDSIENQIIRLGGSPDPWYRDYSLAADIRSYLGTGPYLHHEWVDSVFEPVCGPASFSDAALAQLSRGVEEGVTVFDFLSFREAKGKDLLPLSGPESTIVLFRGDLIACIGTTLPGKDAVSKIDYLGLDAIVAARNGLFFKRGGALFVVTGRKDLPSDKIKGLAGFDSPLFWHIRDSFGISEEGPMAPIPHDQLRGRLLDLANLPGDPAAKAARVKRLCTGPCDSPDWHYMAFAEDERLLDVYDYVCQFTSNDNVLMGPEGVFSMLCRNDDYLLVRGA
jgi:hypothetical protein